MNDELTITKKDAALIAEIVVLRMKDVLKEQISSVIEAELSPLLEEMVQSITSSYKSLNEIQNFMSFINKRSPKEESPIASSKAPHKRGFKNIMETGDTLGDQYAHAPNRYPREEREEKKVRQPINEEVNWDDDDDSNDEIGSMFSINDRLLEEEEDARRKLEAQSRFNRLDRNYKNEEQPKNTEHDTRAETSFVEDFLKESSPAFAHGSRPKSRSAMGSVAPEREEDLMDEIIDDDVRGMMSESSASEYDPTASYDDFFIPTDVNVSEVAMPNMSHASSQQTNPVRGEQIGMRDGSGWEPIPPPQVI